MPVGARPERADGGLPDELSTAQREFRAPRSLAPPWGGGNIPRSGTAKLIFVSDGVPERIAAALAGCPERPVHGPAIPPHRSVGTRVYRPGNRREARPERQTTRTPHPGAVVMPTVPWGATRYSRPSATAGPDVATASTWMGEVPASASRLPRTTRRNDAERMPAWVPSPTRIAECPDRTGSIDCPDPGRRWFRFGRKSDRGQGHSTIHVRRY